MRIKMLNLYPEKRSDYQNMEEKNKQTYLAPLTLVFEVMREGVICQSPTGTNGTPTYNGFNTEEEW